LLFESAPHTAQHDTTRTLFSSLFLCCVPFDSEGTDDKDGHAGVRHEPEDSDTAQHTSGDASPKEPSILLLFIFSLAHFDFHRFHLRLRSLLCRGTQPTKIGRDIMDGTGATRDVRPSGQGLLLLPKSSGLPWYPYLFLFHISSILFLFIYFVITNCY
jgi:hypothetical protein